MSFLKSTSNPGAGRVFPETPKFSPEDEESLSVWGFRDTHFKINPNGSVTLTGNRYSLCGEELPNLLPWVRDVMEVPIDPHDVYPSNYPTKIPTALTNKAFYDEIQTFLNSDQIVSEEKIRLRHGHGHTQSEMYAIKHGELGRIPDLVVYPNEEEQVASLVKAAKRHQVCLIPFGGGTSVTEALRCPENETRMIVSVDTKRLNRVLWIDPTNRTACIQAGALGRDIQKQLKAHGFTMGHEPDSVEFSTLGGWIATHASGMKKNRYGNIEDLILDMNVVTAEGNLQRNSIFPRESAGIDPRLILFGSEGNLGIITSATVKLFPAPEVQRYGSILFPSFEKGVNFFYEMTQTMTPPASIRLVDNLQFQFSLALKPAATGLKKIKSTLEKFLVTKLLGFNPKEMVACTIVFEGTKEEVARQEKSLYRLAKRFGGMKAGEENGKRGYQLTFGIAYIRDFVMNHYFLAESFETSVSWSQVLALCENVKARIYKEHAQRGLPGKPFVTCRVTQVYETGVCVYFYFGYFFKGVANPSQVYSEMEEIAREEVLANGGSLSHHHGIGKLRRHFLPQIQSKGSLHWIRQVKQAVDPDNVFGADNQLLDEQEHSVGARLIEPAPRRAQ